MSDRFVLVGDRSVEDTETGRVREIPGAEHLDTRPEKTRELCERALELQTSRAGERLAQIRAQHEELARRRESLLRSLETVGPSYERARRDVVLAWFDWRERAKERASLIVPPLLMEIRRFGPKTELRCGRCSSAETEDLETTVVRGRCFRCLSDFE